MASYPARQKRLALSLENLCRGTDFKARIAQDPISFLHRFKDSRDIEIVGWIVSALAYGRVPLFQAAMEKILALMEGKPYEYVMRFDPDKDLEEFRPLYYRMNRGEDIACFIYIIQQVIARHGSVGALFVSLYREEDPDIGPTLERFVGSVLEIDTSPIYGNRVYPRGLSQFFSLPSKGSACKRLNLYLRWMVRPGEGCFPYRRSSANYLSRWPNDGLDFGLWKGIPPSKLIVPLDTHVLRISRYLGLTQRRTSSWATAKAITGALNRIDPKDPLRFDFPLCHHGISGNCPIGRAPIKCEACPLLGVCAKGRRLVTALQKNQLLEA